ncbi:MAG: DUF2911 domain-containing protein [Saprospiraceae bacterium]|nr:DUF2911 domain-containing protein [Saprospiraceae bacterium]
MTKPRLHFVVILLFAVTSVWAQITTPAASPLSKLEQKVGLTDIKIEYSRPSAKGRKIFGADGLVSYGSLWRTGANNITKITFSDDVSIEGQPVKKGDYGLLVKPNSDNWTVNFYKYDGGNWSSYVDKVPDVSAVVKPKANGMNLETFTIDINNIETSKATLNLMWEKTVVPVQVSVEVDKQVMANIEKVMAGPSVNDYYNAASYYHESGRDLEQALEWVRKATKVSSPKFWQVRKEALILADLGKYNEAIEAAKMSKELAAAADNQEYVKMNEVSIAEWMKK